MDERKSVSQKTTHRSEGSFSPEGEKRLDPSTSLKQASRKRPEGSVCRRQTARTDGIVFGKQIASAAQTKELLRRHGLSAKKGLGQNFLTDAHVLDKIITAADISADELVIEIGPGLGALTQELCRKSAAVTAVELDGRLAEVLRESLADYANLEIINSDILKLDIDETIRRRGYPRATVVANLPYYITTPIIMRLLEGDAPLKSITVMVQKEVASRLAATPGTKDYGALSLAVNYRAEVYLVANVPRNCFIPRPSVDSAVVRLTPRPPTVAAGDERLFFEIIKAAFANRRKTLLNCLRHSGLVTGDKERIAELLVSCGFSENIRGEELGLAEFARLTASVAAIGAAEGPVSEM